MNKLNFKKLKNPMVFQELCADLLKLEGCENVRGLGKGADQGVDIIFDLPIKTALGVSSKKFIVQCKCYDTKNSVGQNEIGNVIGYMETHEASGLLIITSSSFTGTAITKMESIDKSNRQLYELKYWNGFELTKRIIKYPQLISQYWHQTYNKENSIRKEFIPEFNKNELLKKYEIPRYIQNFSIDTFPVANNNQKILTKMRKVESNFIKNPPSITLIDGAIGAGKTIFAWLLLSAIKKKDYSIIGIDCSNEFNESFINFKLNRANDYLPLYSLMETVDYLLLDDFGIGLDEKSETRLEAITSLIQIVNKRIKNKKITLITRCLSDKMPKVLINYLEYLKKLDSYIFVGNKSIRVPAGTIDEDQFSKENSIPTAFLGKNWLLEKYDIISSNLDYCISILQTPDDLYIEREKYLNEKLGAFSDKENNVIEYLKSTKLSVNKFKNFISTLKFKSFLLDIEEVE